jgi:glycosyltransferase involved in cell wall biosynthesis
MTKFSIIIPAHNEENYLSKTLQSIKQQTFQDYEIIVVTNGCTDKTEEIAKKSNVRVLSLPNPNVSVARNAGALSAVGEVLVFLDADTQLEKGSLQKIHQEFTENYSVASTKVLPDSKNKKHKSFMSFKNLIFSNGLFKGFSGVFICNKKHFQEINGYNPEKTVGEQRELRQKLTEVGKYRCIDTYVTTSMRRYNQWTLARYLKFWSKHFLKDNQKNYENIR